MLCESNRVWKDVLENRYLPLTLLNQQIESRSRPAEGQANDREPKNKFAFKRLLNFIWDKLLIAKQARKQNVLEVSKRFLVDVEQHLMRSDNENLQGVALVNEKYMYLQERMKLVLHYFRNHVKLNIKGEEIEKLRNQLLSTALNNISSPATLEPIRKLVTEVLDKQPDGSEKTVINCDMWESDLYRLRGEILMENKDYDEANENFLKSIELCSTSYKSWRSLAFASEKFADMAAEEEKQDTAKIVEWT